MKKRINAFVTQEAFDIVQRIPHTKKGEFISKAIVELFKSENRNEIFTQEQLEYLNKNFEKKAP